MFASTIYTSTAYAKSQDLFFYSTCALMEYRFSFAENHSSLNKQTPLTGAACLLLNTFILAQIKRLVNKETNTYTKGGPSDPPIKKAESTHTIQSRSETRQRLGTTTVANWCRIYTDKLSRKE